MAAEVKMEMSEQSLVKAEVTCTTDGSEQDLLKQVSLQSVCGV